MKKTNDYIPVDECQDRRLYRIHSRNLNIVGVYNAEHQGFIGIREKFGSRYLFMEFHWDTGMPFGTVQPDESTPEILPDDILLAERLEGSICQCGVDVDFIQDDPKSSAGHWEHLQPSPKCNNIRAYTKTNKELFKWLEEMEEKYPR
jgi:hypothetical protein